MKEIINKIRFVFKQINKGVVVVLLSLVYLLIWVYHVFMKPSKQRWHLKKGDNQLNIERTKNLW